MGDVWSMIAMERRGLSDDLQELTEEQWATPSLCTGWAVRDVVAHLLMPFHVSTPRMLWMMATNRFDFDKLSDKYARSYARPTTDLVADLRANALHHFTPPGFGPEAPLTDVVVHGQDIRRPLGLVHTIPDEHARVVLGLLVSPKAARGFGTKGLLTGIRVEVDELGWSHGSGPVVSGRAEPMIMALAGRSASLDELAGPGLTELRSRI
jgi:uncharacterized protein (TIGR03083 family)